ncbi:hypothetical protein B0I35DRAFT_443346 [Stachybotrys elegans]|uniref:CSC1/OSCA1-like 7TM region domain-containing protein n=1 Tax=Stachybotrys elegans TaxID=80388 RepID=A0A8K0WL60_9HYPO|nr:hypothetical protein B0I35DRAFT_443346 [Stachybotrys elegans]
MSAQHESVASGHWAQWLVARQLSLDQQDDPRLGAGRNDSDGGGTLSTNAGSTTASASKLGATFVPIVIYLAVCLVVFLTLRPRCKRVYGPRAIPALRLPYAASPELPDGWFDWIKPFFRIPDSYVLNNVSLDAFFFLRYLKVLRTICIAGCCIIWPILLPIHGTGGKGSIQLDMLTMGNVEDPRFFFAHAFVAWIFFGFILFMIVRECIYFVNLRQAYLSSPYYADRVESRTMLITGVPRQYLDERRLRKLYGPTAKRIWIPRTAKPLVNMVKEREQTAMRLEKAEIELIKKANAKRQKHLRKHPEAADQVPNPGHDLPLDLPLDLQSLEKDSAEPQSLPETMEDEYVHPYGLHSSLPDVRGSVAALWLPASSRPHHRPLGNYFRRVDTIRWTRSRLKSLNQAVYKLRRVVARGDGDTLPAAFVEFDSQENAQAAQQTLIHHRPFQMATRLLGIRPNEVIWSSLRMPWWEIIVRRTFVTIVIIAAIIFWSIPSAFVGLVSNIESLSTFPLLTWITLLPQPILGFLSGFIPPFALSLLMALVPAMLRFCATLAGVPSRVMVELYCQQGYFPFQVVQVFLITTLTSAASGAVVEIIQEPFQAQDLLAQNIPRASNFYLSYILIQSIAAGAGGLLHLFDLFRHQIFSRLISIPRAQHKLWSRLRPVHWGGVFPVFTNMGVIVMAYACIAPLILIFAAAGMAFMHIVWRYNLIYVYDSDMDSMGLFYPRALKQLIVGLYIAEICLIGLFLLNGAFGPMILLALLLFTTALVHFTLGDAVAPLVQNLPQTLALEEDIREEERAAAAAAAEPVNHNESAGAANDYYDTEQAFGDDNATDSDEEQDDSTEEHAVSGNRALEGSDDIKLILTQWLKSTAQTQVEREVKASGLTQTLNRLKFWSVKVTGEPPNFLVRWFHPEIYDDFVALRKMLPDQVEQPEQNGIHRDYLPTEMWLDKPTLWIPRDEARVSRQEVAHTKPSAPITDLGARLDEKGKVFVQLEKAPFREPRPDL